MSKPTTYIVCLQLARPVAKDAADVVFPTPPLTEVTHMMCLHLLLPPTDFTPFEWERTNECDAELLRNQLPMLWTECLMMMCPHQTLACRAAVPPSSSLPPFLLSVQNQKMKK
eukprot:6547712-Ditylum_brightwellii.AAC.1